MAKIFLTSDLHFGHDKEFIWKARGYDSVANMNLSQVIKYNQTITDDDIVYILGDCIMGEDRESQLERLFGLPGRKHLIIGNHDTDGKIADYQKLNIFESVQMAHRLRYRKKEFILSHYPTIVTNGDDPKPVFNLHGHTHSPDRFELFQYHCYNVGIDAHNGYPVLLDDIVEDIYNKLNEKEKEND